MNSWKRERSVSWLETFAPGGDKDGGRIIKLRVRWGRRIVSCVADTQKLLPSKFMNSFIKKMWREFAIKILIIHQDHERSVSRGNPTTVTNFRQDFDFQKIFLSFNVPCLLFLKSHWNSYDAGFCKLLQNIMLELSLTQQPNNVEYTSRLVNCITLDF